MQQAISFIRRFINQPETPALICNYQDNYYGDQACRRP